MPMIPLDKIVRNEHQPRKVFPADYIRRLAASIKRRGLIQAITVRPIEGDRYMVVAGECRFRAHQELKEKTIRAEIVEIDEAEMQLRAIVENLQRHDMNPIEEANAFRTLLDQGYSIARVVEELELSGPQVVQNRIDLLDLTEDVQRLVAAGTLPVSMGWAVRLAPREHQDRIVRDIASGRLRTVEQVRHAGIALRDALSQLDAFGNLPKASTKDLATMSRLEEKIEAIAAMVAAGFKDGKCVAAQRVSPDRVKLVADKLALVRAHILQMEHDLRCVATQSEIKLEFTEQNNANRKISDHPTTVGAPDRARGQGRREPRVADKLSRAVAHSRGTKDRRRSKPV
jgi:ParB family transcriptional regulator, chromosome partitioning protein